MLSLSNGTGFYDPLPSIIDRLSHSLGKRYVSPTYRYRFIILYIFFINKTKTPKITTCTLGQRLLK